MEIDAQRAAAFDVGAPAGEQAETAGAAAAARSAREDELAAQLAEANARAKESSDSALYALAEIENYKKRAQRQIADQVSHGKKALLKKFLPVIDNLERALAFDMPSEGLRGGLDATLRGFESALASENVTPLSLVGKPFDPRVAEAIGTRETADEEDDTIVAEVQRGYLLGEELLRPALVIVSKKSA
jgi:molecular chaperone GrpE